MNKVRKSAKHTPQAFYDQQSVALVSAWLAETHRAMPDFKADDKWPNTDGYIELTDQAGFSCGTMKVQIKKLPNTSSKSPNYTFKKNGKFLSYCIETNDLLPILFIGVDIKNNFAYWIHINRDTTKYCLENKRKLILNGAQIIKSGEVKFIDEWLKIVGLYKSWSELFEENKKQYSVLFDVLTPALGISDERYSQIHNFLDKLNALLDSEYKVIKKHFTQVLGN